MYTTINAEEAKALIAANENIRILDVRDHRSYRAGHIEGAVMLHDGLEARILEDAEYDRPILVYCYRGVKSKEKAELFDGTGFKQVYMLDGGYANWPREAP